MYCSLLYGHIYYDLAILPNINRVLLSEAMQNEPFISTSRFISCESKGEELYKNKKKLMFSSRKWNGEIYMVKKSSA
jgi:hypothetical protein